jgi:hypothetical protein
MQQAIVQSATIIRAMQKDGARAGGICFQKLKTRLQRRRSPRWLSGDQQS